MIAVRELLHADLWHKYSSSSVNTRRITLVAEESYLVLATSLLHPCEAVKDF